jgi:hypothetical protein
VKHKVTIRFLLSDFDTVSVPCRLPAIDMIQNGHTIFHRIVFSLKVRNACKSKDESVNELLLATIR